MGKAHSNAWRNVRRLPPRRARRAPAGAGRPGRRGVKDGRGPVRLGRVGHRLAHASSTATTSTSSTSASPGTCTPRSPSRRSRPASTCWSRSRWPTAVAEAEKMVAARRPRRERGVHVDGRLQLPPGAGPGAGPRPDRRRPARRRPPGAGRLPPGLARRRRRPDDVAAAQARPPARARSATSASHAVDQVRFLLGQDGDVGVSGAPAHVRPAAHGRRRARGRSPSTTPPGRTLRTVGRCRGQRSRSRRMATGRKNALSIEVYGIGGRAAPSTSSALNELSVCTRRPPPASRRRAGHRGRPPVRRRLVAARATSSAGTTPSPARPPTSSPRSPPATSRRRRSPTGSPCSGCWRRSRRVRHGRAQRRRRGRRRSPDGRAASPSSPASGPT